MANILKNTKTYTDSRGVVYSSAYMIIDNFIGTSTPAPSFGFSIKIFKDLAARLAGFEPVFLSTFYMSTADIITYLGTPKDASSQEIPTEFAKRHIYTYLGTVQPIIPGIVWSDWKSDEIGGVPQTFIKTR